MNLEIVLDTHHVRLVHLTAKIGGTQKQIEDELSYGNGLNHGTDEKMTR